MSVSAPARPRVEPLLEVFQEIGRSLELGRTADTILAGARRVVSRADRATITVVGLDGRAVRCRRARGRGASPSKDLRRRRRGRRLASGGIVGSAFDSGRACLREDVGPEARDPDLHRKTRSVAAAPLLGAGGRRIGVLAVESSVPGILTSSDCAALRAFALGVAPAVERILFYEKAVEGRRLVSELEVAGKVLQDLLPRRRPDLAGLDVAAAYEPCAQVGGDYYDFIPLAEDRMGIAVADVSGKGVPAALLVAVLRASVFSLANSDLSLRAILSRTNRLLYESVGETRYATLFYGVLDVPLRRLIYINAGHSPPVLVRASGEVEFIHAGGLPVGLFPSPRYFEQDIRLSSGDLLALYTDGVTESADANEDLYGRDRLAELLDRERRRGSSASAICDRVLRVTRRFRPGAPEDDSTVLVIRAT